MSRKGAILLPVLVILVIIAIAIAGGVYSLYRSEYAQNIKLQAQVTDLENRQKATAGLLDESKQKATDLELQLQEAKSRIENLAGELNLEKIAHADTSSKLEQLKQDLSTQKIQREDLETRLNQVQEDGKQIKEQIKLMQEQKATLEEKIKNLEIGAANVELGKVVVSPEATAVASPAAPSAKLSATPLAPAKAAAKPVSKVVRAPVAGGLEGKVMIVNKEFNFVVINLGSKDRVNIGDEFSVSRAGKTIGDLKVEKVHEFMSAAGFSPEIKDQIRENDTVTLKSR